MTDIPITANERKAQFTGNTGLGPFAFTFNILATSDIRVIKNGTVLTLTSEYTVTTNANGTGSITLTGSGNGTALISTDILTIIGNRQLARTSDYVQGGNLFAGALNEDLDSIVIMMQQLDEKVSRTMRIDAGDIAENLLLPDQNDRKGKYLAFNATTGDPEAGPTETDVVALAAITSDIALLADIEDGTIATDAITTVSGISSNVTTVAGISGNVTTVAGNTANINTVAADLAGVDDIGTVAGSIASVNTTAGSIGNVNTVASDLGGTDTIGTVATNIANVNTVAGISANVTTVAGISADVTAVVADEVDIGIVAADLTGSNTVGTVAGIAANVTTVAGISADVTTVAADGTDIGTVATNIANVNTVAGISGNVTTVAGISADVTAVAGDATDIGTVSANIANVNTVAGISANVTTVAGISADVTTVAGISADVVAAPIYASDAESARDQAQAARDTAEDHKLAAEAAATSATNTAAALTGFDLDAIAASKAVTAVDVFVYDTSRDSDGGAWRKRTQGTSWYNETLNTATRGSRREFPAVAVLVLTSSTLTIYDGDDPSLPMWMVFSGGAANMMNANSCSSVAMLNGRITVGNFLYDVVSIDFAGDRAARAGTTTIFGPYLGNVLTRNSNSGWASNTGSFFTNGPIVNRTVNDVAMTVLPDAPIDPATGLPVPTIAVATAGGVSVIKDDGTVVDSASTTAFKNVNFDAENTLYYGQATFNLALIRSTSYESDGFSGTTFFGGTGLGSLETAPILIGGDTEKSSYAFAKNREFFGGGNTASGFTRLGFARYFLGTTQMTAFATSTYNTGWQNGDIKGAFLSDTDDTDLVGSTIYTSDFTSTVDGFTGNNATLTLDADRLKVEDAGANGVGYQNFSVTAGKPYVLKVRYNYPSSNTNSDYALQVRATSFTGTIITQKTTGFVEDTPTDATLYFTPTVSTVSVLLAPSSATGDVGFFDNVSVKLADADRSVNNNGLIVNGTVTRSPVATGADLVAYSGFSASNYLEQPYNSALDFGTGDFCVMGWVKAADTGGTNTSILMRSGATGLGKIRVRSRLGKFAMWISDDGASTIDEVISTSDIDNNNWNFVCSVRQGSFIYAYVNGSLETTASVVNAAGSLSSSDATTRVGISDAGTEPWTGSLALLRISATAPTASQIEKIYNDERVLFQEKAQATLYGASDAVTALAHDPDTDLLHVGTSAGRSIFEGLRRVGNTTTSVSKSISASGGLIVEK